MPNNNQYQDLIISEFDSKTTFNIISSSSSVNVSDYYYKDEDKRFLADNSTPTKTTTSKDSMRRMKLKYIRTVFIVAVIFILVSLFYFNTDVILPQRLKNLVYTVVIDAGSTGSRIHVFKLIHEDFDNNPETLDVKLINEELVHKIKPGLSSYAHDPDKAAESLKPLLDNAMRVIPEEHISNSRIVLKATAGLRLISNEIANKILYKVKNLLKIYPFKLKENDVDIMDGKYEGVYSWLTLNYALDNFVQSKEYHTCSLDLGGGSTQINFIPTDKETLKRVNLTDMVKFTLDEVKYQIYAKSYLGFGLMSARKSIFELDSDQTNTAATTGGKKLRSVCLNSPPSGLKWVHQNIEYSIDQPPTTTSNSSSIFDQCYSKVRQTLGNKFLQLPELNSKDVYAFSYFYDRLNSAKLLKDDYEIKIKDIYNKAQSVCNDPISNENKEINTSDKEYPFLCMDLTFIYSILADGYGLPQEKEIFVRSEVNKMEISWALGAAFHLIHT